MSSERYLFLIKGSLVMAQPLAAPETGELLDYDAFEQLQMDREHKIVSVISTYPVMQSILKSASAVMSVLTTVQKSVLKK